MVVFLFFCGCGWCLLFWLWLWLVFVVGMFVVVVGGVLACGSHGYACGWCVRGGLRRGGEGRSDFCFFLNIFFVEIW